MLRPGSKANGPEWHQRAGVALGPESAHSIGTYDRLVPCEGLWVGLTADRAWQESHHDPQSCKYPQYCQPW